MRASRAIIISIWVSAAGAVAWGFVPEAAALFTEQAQFGSGHTIAVAWGDSDNDGDLDVAVGNYTGVNELYLNNGDGSFTQQDQFGESGTFAVAWADFDNDGDQDIAVGRNNVGTNTIYLNNGDGTFTAGPTFGSRRTNSVAWADYDRDGDLDLAVGNGLLGTDQQNQLYVNNGDGTFTRIAQFGLNQSASVVWGDYDNDGDPDLAVGNGGFGYEQQNYLYVNNSDGTFTESAQFGGEDTACLAWGDCDNDGDLDMAVGNWNGGPNYLYVNNGDGTFTGAPQFGARDCNTLAWGDCDNDGDLDLAVGNGDFTSADQNYLYINNADGTFTEQAEFGLGSTDAVAWGDYDRDGDLDVAVGNEHSPSQNYLYVNGENDGDFLILKLRGHFDDLGPGYSNRDGVGAKIAAYEAGFVGDPAHLLAHREIEAHGGFSAQNAIEAHLGLPGRALVDVRITWPGSAGTHFVQDLPGLTVGQRLMIEEVDLQGIEHGDMPEGGTELLRISPNPTRGGTHLSWRSARMDSGGTNGLGARAGCIAIYSPSGRLLRALQVTGPDAGGFYQADWDGRTSEGALVPAGVYLARGLGRHARASAKMLVIR